ncbi:MAG: M50 family metallopeptidase [Alphaproteobacteria bacterium]
MRPILIYATLGFILLNFKSIAVPIGWFEVFFHEIAHGLASIVTGGRILTLELNLNGSGSLTHSGSHFVAFVSFAGYAGASLWGLITYSVFSRQNKPSRNWVLALGVFVLISTLLWARDWETLVVSLLIITILGGLYWLDSQRLNFHVMGLLGACLMVSSSQSAWGLLSVEGRGDAGALASALFLPAFVWVLVWIAFSLACLVWIYRNESKRDQRFRF